MISCTVYLARDGWRYMAIAGKNRCYISMRPFEWVHEVLDHLHLIFPAGLKITSVLGVKLPE